MNDISEGCVCSARSLVTKIEKHLEHKAFKPFRLTLELLMLLICDFHRQLEAALTNFETKRRFKSYMKWLRILKTI
jgi:hypothetical protein